MALSARRLAFVREYVANGGNATQAYISAGYSKGGAAQAAEKLLRNAEVRGEIATRVARKQLSADVTVAEVVSGLRIQAEKGSTKAWELLGKHIGMWGEGGAQGDGWDDLAKEANGTRSED